MGIPRRMRRWATHLRGLGSCGTVDAGGAGKGRVLAGGGCPGGFDRSVGRDLLRDREGVVSSSRGGRGRRWGSRERAECAAAQRRAPVCAVPVVGGDEVADADGLLEAASVVCRERRLAREQELRLVAGWVVVGHSGSSNGRCVW